MKNIEPGEYIWKSKDFDYPVTVIGYLGQGPDGRDYVRIEGSQTAVPADELHKKVKVVSRKPPPRKFLGYVLLIMLLILQVLLGVGSILVFMALMRIPFLVP